MGLPSGASLRLCAVFGVAGVRAGGGIPDIH